MISAEVILDSVSPHGHRLTTFRLRYPKFIHGEFMTHRVFSRNASSSRAVPVSKLIDEVTGDDTRAEPVWWGANQGGMQADAELTGLQYKEARYRWREAAMAAANEAQFLALAGAHKQLVNRILEPFTHINVVCTATEYMNFFGLRLDRAAQPEMRALAEAMWRAYGESQPEALNLGEWHLPFIGDDFARSAGAALISGSKEHAFDVIGTCLKVSVARCARVSYQSNETGRRSTIEEDLKLYDRLLSSQPLHASPAEHQAMPDEKKFGHGDDYNFEDWCHFEQHGNFTGWCQYRKMLPGESLAALPPEYQSRK